MPFALFVLLWGHGAFLGLTDDEAYYWVLAQRPAAGYAFHPPMVAWVIAVIEGLFESFLEQPSPAIVRLPAAFFSAVVLAIGLNWIKRLGFDDRPALMRAGFVILSFVGFFGASWMMVPDLPLLAAWMSLFLITWRICHDPQPARWLFWMMGIASAFAILSKYSGVLAVASSFICMVMWAPRRFLLRGSFALAAGCILAAIPILWWNLHHEWASILYQLRDRHGGSGFSGLRYARFWVIQAVLAGPPLLLYLGVMVRRAKAVSSPERFLLIWITPGILAFCIQPAFAEFKAHWAFVVWLPVALGLALAFAQGQSRIWAISQLTYGLLLLPIVLLMCHLPVVPMLGEFFTGREPDPKWDVTNDMYGWSRLREALATLDGDLPVLASRYQTASQAAFVLGDTQRVSLVPRDLKQRDEWASIDAVEAQGPEWPRLLKPVLFVADNRYDARPEFKNASCERIQSLETLRGRYLAKRIDVWKCAPDGR